ncbi:pyridoxamine 5'-phosphate oxidase family protein, partial [Bacteroides ovatus]
MGRYAVTFARLIKNNQFMTTKTMKEKATELLQRCEVVTLASVNKEGYPRP